MNQTPFGIRKLVKGYARFMLTLMTLFVSMIHLNVGLSLINNPNNISVAVGLFMAITTPLIMGVPLYYTWRNYEQIQEEPEPDHDGDGPFNRVR